jgi:hypothetical protein
MTPSMPESSADRFGPLAAKWRKVSTACLIGGGLLALIAAFAHPKQFGFAYLTAYVFFLSLCVGSLFLVLIHHLFDAAWSVPIRRFVEHMACLLFPGMAVLWIPIGLLAPQLYPWMQMTTPDHALHAKQALLNKPVWYLVSIAVFLIWGAIAHGLRRWSLKQDETGSVECTLRLRRLACIGMFLFAVSTTFAIILWVKSFEHEWFSTMYGVYFFAESVWTTLATIYVLAALLKSTGPLASVMTPRQTHDIAVLWFAFTVFYAYIHFSQYFIIWNGNMPEETFWYLQREQGSWWQVGLLLIFGHFFLPFLLLLRIDAKITLAITMPLAGWAWLMHFCDISFNIMPVFHPTGYGENPLTLGVVLASLAFIGGALAWLWLKAFTAHPPFPQKDPRMEEALGMHHPRVSPLVVAKYEGHP